MVFITSQLSKYVDNKNLRHLLMNYSGTSNGLRHPEGPIGLMLRDEGQLDAYAGKSRLLLGVNGELLTISSKAHHISESTNFTTKGISNFRILGKAFVKNIFEGQKVLAIKPNVDLSLYSIIGPTTYIQNPDGSISKFVNLVPLPQIFDERQIFATDDYDSNLLPPAAELAIFVKSLMGM